MEEEREEDGGRRRARERNAKAALLGWDGVVLAFAGLCLDTLSVLFYMISFDFF